ncbi:DUF4421 domain-containing protein [Mucilaginibacter sp. BJC16-A38]|uniref:DUF4421 domain-containing protein n=1 Tax=Mucilaginibacter phenanthrenivorans TaxID=1234842 RepID=UPI0021579EB5|nr:DUF4421 domain-containing protein [Mucilaginibacter phenanthrenivorans]MCR8559002.1 DUF4421 domain-containing protein [Mucilaginibacter phenanthrenivorans]
MKFSCFALFILIVCNYESRAQTAARDTSYIKSYSQKILLTGYVADNTLPFAVGGKTFSPNNQLNVGVGIAIKNTVINALYDVGLVPLKGAEYGKTNITDLQVHNYGTHLMLDLFLQKYKGFYDNDISHGIFVYPNLSFTQIGAEGSYIFNGNKFSGRAAYEQSEIQFQSAGSFILGGGAYLYRLGLDSSMSIPGNQSIRNFQVGVNVGYGYSWVINDRWLLSGMLKLGANAEDEPELSGGGKTKIYPTAFLRGSSVYQKPDWSVCFLMLINNKTIYAYDQRYSLASVDLQLSYTRHLNSIFKKKKSRQ